MSGSKKVLQAWARLGLRHLFTADDLDPQNAPRLAGDLETLKSRFVAFAEDPNGLEKQFYDLVNELREQFVEADPRLRLRYAPMTKDDNGEEVTH